jgi:predicted nucleic acid-binding protein
MAHYLIDTSVLLRVANGGDPLHQLAKQATARLRPQGDFPFLTGQVMIEFWSVATRPVANNGFAWDPARVVTVMDSLLVRFPLLDDNADIFPNWRHLVVTHGVRGKQVHDARLVAVMLAHRLTHILTFNLADFRRYRVIDAVDPASIVGGP